MLFGDDSKLRNFVNRALFCWNGSRVLKFRFDSHNKLVSSMFNDVDLWVSFAQRNGVEELHLDVKKVYRMPPCLYSCSSLKELSLYWCNLEIYGNVQWNKLESLKISGISATADVINQILSGTPQLKVFNLIYYDKGGYLSIQSTSLKKLSICKVNVDVEDLFFVSELRICTPNLETLDIIGDPYKKYSLTDVSSLTNAVFGFLALNHMSLTGLSSTLSQFLPSIQLAENITLLNCCPKVLGALKMKCAHSVFRNVKSLVLGCSLDDCKQVVGVLEMFPHYRQESMQPARKL